MGTFQREWIGMLTGGDRGMSLERQNREKNEYKKKNKRDEGERKRVRCKGKKRKVHAIRKLAELGKFVFRH